MIGIRDFKVKFETLRRVASERGFSPSLTNTSKFITLIGRSGGLLNGYYKSDKLPSQLEQVIALLFGFGPSEEDFDQGFDIAWAQWAKGWRCWRTGDLQEFEAKIADMRLVPADPGSPRAAQALERCARFYDRGRPEPVPLPSLPSAPSVAGPSSPAPRSSKAINYVKRLATLSTHLPSANYNPEEGRTLTVACSFGVITFACDDVIYTLRLGRCILDLALREAATKPNLPVATQALIGEAQGEVAKFVALGDSDAAAWQIRNPKPHSHLLGSIEYFAVGTIRGELHDGDRAALVANAGAIKVSRDGEKAAEEDSVTTQRVIDHLVKQFALPIEDYEIRLSQKDLGE